MSRPRLLLLDEPSLGLAPLLVKQIFDAIRELNESEKLTVFLVEQNAYHALKLAHRGYVMVNGLITMSGPGRELLKRPEVRAAYLEGGRGAEDDVKLYAAETWLQVLLVTGVIGGGAALTDRPRHRPTWRPSGPLIVYILLLCAGVRFLHFALFFGYILSLPSYLVDALFPLAVGSISFRLTRTGQMTQQYPWLTSGPARFSWRERQPEA